jgi:hypothetical protein
MAQIINDPNGGINSGGKPNGMYTNNVTSTPVLCKDGTTKNQLSSPIGRYSDACMNNGGRAENQPINTQQAVMRNTDVLNAEDKFYEMFGIKKSSGGWGIQSRPLGRILVGVILVAGYFAYKKFKK